MDDYESRIGMSHKDYVALYRLMGDTWSALIRRPNSPLFWELPTVTTREEGEMVLMRRIRAAIDADIASGGKDSS
jgi:hypothetical protein